VLELGCRQDTAKNWRLLGCWRTNNGDAAAVTTERARTIPAEAQNMLLYRSIRSAGNTGYGLEVWSMQ